METFAAKQSTAVFKTSLGLQSSAKVLQLTAVSVSLEIHHPDLVLQVSEVLQDFEITIREQKVYAGRAVVSQVVSMGATMVCAVKLESGRMDNSFFAAVRNMSELRAQFQGFMGIWHETYKVLPEYKIAVADLQSYLTGLREWLEQIELGIRSTPSNERGELERATLEELGRLVVPIINRFFDELENLRPQISPEGVGAHRAHLQSQLHPLVLCSPFAFRTYAKPLGYAGDYEMVNMMTRNPFEGGSIFAKLLNLWFLEQPPAQAHRNRVTHLQSILLEETARVTASGRRTRVLNVGCGPAVEVQRFIASTPAADRVSIELLDFNAEALAHLKNTLDEIKRKHERSTTLTYINKPVHQLIKQSISSFEQTAERQYDLIYCAGLFDYLTDSVCQRLNTFFFDRLAPGGLLLVTNVDPSNPLRYGMEHLLDWHLIYRNGQGLRALAPSQVKPEDLNISSESTGVNLFMGIRKRAYG